MKKFILFDNDGVLVETEVWYYRANVEILKQMGLKIEEERYKEIMIKGQSALMIAEEAGFSSEEVEAARARRNILYQRYIQNEDITIPQAKEIIAALSEHYRMGIITSARREDFELIHHNRGITDKMEFALCSGEYGRSKPHPDPYLEGLAKLGATKEATFVVEDSQRGLESAHAAGIECVIVHNDFTRHHDFSKASHKIAKLADLLSLFENH